MDAEIAALFPYIKSSSCGDEFTQHSYIGHSQSIVLRIADSLTCTVRISNMVCSRYFIKSFDCEDMRETYDLVKNFESYFKDFETVETLANLTNEPYIYKIFEEDHVEVRFATFTALFSYGRVIYSPDIRTILL